MLKIIVTQKAGSIQSIKLDGHTDSANQGEDLLCAAISAISFGAANALKDAPVKVNIGEAGKMEFIKLDDDKDSEVMLNQLLVQISTVAQMNSEFIKIEKVEVE